MLQLRAGAVPEAVLRAVTNCNETHPTLCVAALGSTALFCQTLTRALHRAVALAERPGARPLLERCGTAMLRLCALSALNEQNCRLDFAPLGTVVPFSRDEHELLDDTCKRGAPCVVLFPALRTGATLHVKAAVLDESYSLD